MTTQAIPKLLFIDQSTQEIIDKRFSRQQLLIQNDKKQVTKTWEYKWRSKAQLPNGYSLASTGKQDTSIFNTVFSNKNGALIYNSQNGIGVYGLNSIQEMTKDGKIVEPIVPINQKGSIFISPKETKLLVLNSENLYFHSLDKDMPLITSTKNTHKFTNAFWENQQNLFLWSFESKVYRFCLTNSQFKQIEGIQKCTGIHRLSNDKISIIQSMKLFIFQKGQMVKEIDLATIENPNANLFQYMCIIGIAKLNNTDKQQFCDDDKYVLIAIYYTAYDEGDSEPCGRFAFYLKGNLYGDNLKARGDDLIMVMKDSQRYYLQQDQSTKIGFDCILERTDRFVLVLISKIDYLFMIDSTEEFEKLGIFSTWPKHTYKLPENSSTPFFKGLAIMKNMLPFQKIAVPSDPISKIYCNQQFKGQFMRLFFSHKQCQLTIEFPISAIAFADNFFIKKYVGCTVDFIQQQKQQEIIKQLKKVKKSRYIIEASNPLQLKQTTNKKQNPSILPQHKKQQKEQQKQVPQETKTKTQQIIQPTQNSIFTKKQQTTSNVPQVPQNKPSLFGNTNFSGNTIFNNTNSLNTTNVTSPIGSKTFGSSNTNGSTFGTIFGASNSSGLIFGTPNATGSTIFGSTFGTSGPTFGTSPLGGMFSAPKLTTTLPEKPKESLTDKNNSESLKTNKINPVDQTSKPIGTQQKSMFNFTTENPTKTIKQQPKDTTISDNKPKGFGFGSLGGGLFGSQTTPKVETKVSPIITLDQKVELVKPSQSQTGGMFSQAQSTQKQSEKVQNNEKKQSKQSKQAKQQKLKVKLQYFIQQMDSVKRKILLYETEQNQKHLFSLNNSKKVLNSWDQLINVNSSQLFESIEKVLPQLTTLEKQVKLKKIKQSQIHQKQNIVKNYQKTYQTIDISCYFVSSFQKSNNSNNQSHKSIFGSALKKPQLTLKNQQVKFSSYATKRVQNLQKTTSNLLHKYTEQLYQLKQKQSPSLKKSIIRYKFDSNLESDSSQDDKQQNQNFFSTFNSKQSNNTTKSSIFNSSIKSKIKLQTLQNFQFSTFSIETNKPFFKFQSLQEPKTDQPKNKQPNKQNNLPKKQQTTSKPFSSKIPPPNPKPTQIKTIPIMQNLTNKKQQTQIVNSQNQPESQQTDTVAPIIGNRTISSMPDNKNLNLPPKDNKQSKTQNKPSTNSFAGFGLNTSFGNNFTSSGMFGAPKPNLQKTKIQESKPQPIKTVKTQQKTQKTEQKTNKNNLFNTGTAFGSISNPQKDNKPFDFGFSGLNISNKQKQKEKTDTNNLFNKTQNNPQTKSENKTQNKNQDKPSPNGLFGKTEPFQIPNKKQNQKQKNTQKQKQKQQQQKDKKQINLFTNTNQKILKKTNSNQQIKIPQSTNKQPQQKTQQPSKIPQTNPNTNPILNNNTTPQNNLFTKNQSTTNNIFTNNNQNNTFNQTNNQNQQNLFTNQKIPLTQPQPQTFNQSTFPTHATTSFGSGNSRFNTTNSDQTQQQQSFNPSAMSFGGGSALKSFSSVGTNNNSNLFGAQQNQQSQQGQNSTQGWNQGSQLGSSWLNQNNNGNNNNSTTNLNQLGQNQNQGWAQNNSFGQGNTQSNPFGQFGQANTQSNPFGQGNTQSNSFGQGNSQPSWGGQTGQGGLFGSTPSTGGMGASGFSANSSMMQPRK